MSNPRRTSVLMSAALALGATLAPGSSASAAPLSEVNFEGGPADWPCAFSQVNPLRDRYAGFGIHFRGPTTTGGAAILDRCSNFGVPARSGVRFLAFNADLTLHNGGVPKGPETISFDQKKTVVQVYVSQGSSGGNTASFKLVGKRAGHTVRTATTTTTTNAYTLLKVTAPGGMNKVVLSANDPDRHWVADDLAVHN